MIQVPLDKIIPIEEALLDIGKIMDNVRNEHGLYVITKDGKPHSAIIDIDMLEHLPEMKDAGETKPIGDIAPDNSYEGIQIDKEKEGTVIDAPQQETPVATPEPAPDIQKSTPTPMADDMVQEAQKEVDSAIADDIGPWGQGSASPEPAQDGDPQDLDI
jgi:prevent-host-death family protein